MTLNRPSRFLLLPLAVLALSACSSAPRSDISLIPAQTEDQTQKDGVFTQPLNYQHVKPGCTGECPSLDVKSLIFPGNQALTALVDRSLAQMTILGEREPGYRGLKEFENYYWATANGKDKVQLTARTRYRNRDLTVVELGSWLYMTGAAHSIAASQFLNWDNRLQMALPLDRLLVPGRQGQFQELVRQAHAAWVQTLPDAQQDPQGWARMWPFQPASNAALTDKGVVVKYNAYEIAPYSLGQPELLLPYAQLRGILRPDYLPAS
ncbi:RsiV family protein [Alcaligenes sp. WGS1538]|uniref:RsiV family protein n=1 Tax=Alcaligenes sp. WGS1538 TaxID=3366811 RepID=UPI00372D6C6E